MSMPFSSDEQVQKSNDFLYNLKSVACTGCARGVRMCYHTPCIGTVDDIEKIINAGYAKSLMLDWWVGIPMEHRMTDKYNPFTEDVMYLIPAIVGSEGKKAKFARSGKCTMLENNLCKLHDSGLKPIQGKLACCKVERIFMDNGEEKDLDERIPVLHTWNTQRGKDLIERWKKEVNFGNEDTSAPRKPENMADMLDLLIGIFGSMDKMQNPEGKDGRPDYDPNEHIEREVQCYEKPY